KPDPDIFIHAARLLGVAPARAFGVEDAISGVAALKAAGYALVVGVDRGDQRDALQEHGADVVVRDLADLQLEVPKGSVQLPDALESADEIIHRLENRRPAVFLDY